ncbi:hypothetical protein GO986_14320 [Deinococcus sp. HMF7620]|uniref:Uncharacterized protein n=1 Tax=Deinococcus arboris TaxID=2682977 RepID=A0A7C9HST9_9DEIO|nr:hypothetical protein [Deinococcus arboris]MVN87933.1 hypothetical protein [Deinococcus arboris]
MTLPAQAATLRKPPSSTVGYVLNFFLPGAGFTLIGLWGWHLFWLAFVLAMGAVAALVNEATASPVGQVLIFATLIAMMVHFGRTYGQQEAKEFPSTLGKPAKIALVLGHVALRVVLLTVTTLLPLSDARSKMEQAHDMALASAVKIEVVLAQADGKLRDGPCPLSGLSTTYRDKIASCTVTGSASKEPDISLILTDGQTLSVP